MLQTMQVEPTGVDYSMMLRCEEVAMGLPSVYPLRFRDNQSKSEFYSQTSGLNVERAGGGRTCQCKRAPLLMLGTTLELPRCRLA